MTFEWDEAKNKINQAKHGISFEEAQSVFEDAYIGHTVSQVHIDQGLVRHSYVVRFFFEIVDNILVNVDGDGFL